MVPWGVNVARAVCTVDRTLHVLFSQGSRILQVHVRRVRCSRQVGLLAEIPTHSASHRAELEALACFSCLRETGCFFARYDPPDPRGSRLKTILLALDGALAGATQREIATVLVGAERVATDWEHPGQHLRDRVRRAIRRGRALMNGGYLALLR